MPRSAPGRTATQRARARIVGGIVLLMLVLVVALVLRMSLRRAGGLLVAALAEDIAKMPPTVCGEGVEPARLEELRQRWLRMRERVAKGDGDLGRVAEARGVLSSAVRDGRIDLPELGELDEATAGW